MFVPRDAKECRQFMREMDVPESRPDVGSVWGEVCVCVRGGGSWGKCVCGEYVCVGGEEKGGGRKRGGEGMRDVRWCGERCKLSEVYPSLSHSSSLTV